MKQYEVAYLNVVGDRCHPSLVRFSSAATENISAHRALRLANQHKHTMCVVVEGTNEVVQIIRYYPPKEHKKRNAR